MLQHACLMAMMSRGEDQCVHCVLAVKSRPWTGIDSDISEGLDDGIEVKKALIFDSMVGVVVVIVVVLCRYCGIHEAWSLKILKRRRSLPRLVASPATLPDLGHEAGIYWRYISLCVVGCN